MKRLLRRLGIVSGGLVALIVVACVVVYALSEHVLRRTYPVPSVAIAVPNDPASIAEGRRLATIRGCFGGCHGKEAEGAVMFDQPLIARITAPNLTASVRKYDAAELSAIIRHGVRPDGRSVLVMPSEVFIGLNDTDLGRIIAFLRSLPPAKGPGPDISPGPLGRIGFLAGKFKTAAELIAESVPPPPASGEEATHGRYLAFTVCGACHGTDLRGTSNPDFTSPSLDVVAAYSPDAFKALLRTGTAIGGRELRTMGPYARAHLSALTDDEIGVLYSYLHALPAEEGKH